MNENHNQKKHQLSARGNRSNSLRSWARFSIRSILILTALVAVLISFLMNASIQESKSVSDFVGPPVEGRINEFRPKTISKFTPDFLKRKMGEQYFQTAYSASVRINFDSEERSPYHHQLSLELTIQCISDFGSLHFLDLDFRGTKFDSLIDLSPLRHCRHLEKLYLNQPNAKIVMDICEYTNIIDLTVSYCEFENEMIEAIVANSDLESISLVPCAITAEQLLSLRTMENRCMVNFSQCRPIENKDGSFDFQKIPHSGAFRGITDRELQLNAKAATWLKRELPGVSWLGLFLPNKPRAVPAS